MDRSIRISRSVVIPADEISSEFSRSSGPGGQHVNKTETRVTLRFCLADSPSIPEDAKKRIVEKLAPRLTKLGELLVSCERHRERSMNIAEAVERMTELLREANKRPKKRRATKPTKGSKERRLKAKRATADRKKGRQTPTRDD